MHEPSFLRRLFFKGGLLMSWDVSYRENGSDVVKHRVSWTSDGSGDASEVSPQSVSGQIERVVFVPSATAAPTNLYDIVLTDEHGLDVLGGQGANLSNSASSHVCPGTPLKDGTTTSVRPMVVDGALTLTVSNAGASKAGEVILYVR
jgi:hypothetical protein